MNCYVLKSCFIFNKNLFYSNDFIFKMSAPRDVEESVDYVFIDYDKDALEDFKECSIIEQQINYFAKKDSAEWLANKLKSLITVKGNFPGFLAITIPAPSLAAKAEPMIKPRLSMPTTFVMPLSL